MNKKYLLADLVALLQEKGYDGKPADLLVRSFFANIEKGLEEDESVKINEFGQFKLQKVEARQSVDVNTGERVEIKPHSKISFVPELVLKELVNRPLSHLQPVVLDGGQALASEEPVSGQRNNVSESLSEEKGIKQETTSPAQLYSSKKNNTMKKEEKPVFEVEETKDVKKQPKKKSGWLWLIVSIIVIASVIYAMLSTESKKDKMKKPVKTEVLSAPVEPAPVVNAPVVDPSSWPIMKEVTLKKGQRLTLLALENYGDKVFWVYIYEANKENMPNPNKLKEGTKIRIPQLPVGLINAKSTESMQRAKALEDKYRAQFAE